MGLAACEKGPQLLPELTGSQFTLLTFQGQTPDLWVTGSGGELRTRNFQFSFGGACVGAVKTVKVFIDDVQSGSDASCTGGVYSWSKNAAVVADGSYNVDLIPYADGGVELTDKKIEKVVQVDNVGPAAITFDQIIYTKNEIPVSQSIASGSNLNLYIDANSDGCTDGKLGVRLTGTYTPDSDRAVFKELIISPSDALAFHSGGNFGFQFCMTAGENRSVSIKAVDDLGNASNTLTTALSTASTLTSIKVGGSFNPGFSGSYIAVPPGMLNGGVTLVTAHSGSVVAEVINGSDQLLTGYSGVLSRASP